jgi:hypothetical protein
MWLMGPQQLFGLGFVHVVADDLVMTIHILSVTVFISRVLGQ